MKLLETRNLCVRAGEKWACRNLDLAVSQGQCWGILGGNGIGKTSLLHAFCGIGKAASGEILLGEKPLSVLSRRQIAKLSGILFQDAEDLFPSTVEEIVLAGRHPHVDPLRGETPADFGIAREAIAATGLAGMEKRLSSTLSGGERRRLSIAALLAQEPDLYLLDEPTNHLDIAHQVGMLDLFAALSERKAVIMILHDPNLVSRYCDRVLLLFGEGRTLCGPSSEILTERNLSELYHHPMESVEGPCGTVFLPSIRRHRPPA
ncbi:MAG: ABC transporter ATP-binding protein [Burkholderiales bacterium]|nr:ABC transporter ATP-binding protein [Burkholderiales bacterium]